MLGCVFVCEFYILCECQIRVVIIIRYLLYDSDMKIVKAKRELNDQATMATTTAHHWHTESSQFICKKKKVPAITKCRGAIKKLSA